jgi:glycosyltransferase involved in cell wall biosynthesis
MSPLVSIYIPSINRLNMLKRAVHSVVGQTFRDIELVVVTDGAEDGSDEFILSVQGDIPVKLISNPCSLGACLARNQAIEAANGRFVTGLDDDDWLRPDRIALFLDKWHRCEAEGQTFSALFDSTIAIRKGDVQTWNWSPYVDLQQIRKVNVMGAQVFTLRQRYLDCGLFDSSMPAWQDWDMWLRLVQSYGPAVGLQQGTYFCDQAHDEPRITTAHFRRIRLACDLFAEKHGLKQAQDLSCLLLAYARYPQAKLLFPDVLTLLKARRFTAALRLIGKGRVSWLGA